VVTRTFFAIWGWVLFCLLFGAVLFLFFRAVARHTHRKMVESGDNWEMEI
jgi:hypothetical protein